MIPLTDGQYADIQALQRECAGDTRLWNEGLVRILGAEVVLGAIRSGQPLCLSYGTVAEDCTVSFEAGNIVVRSPYTFAPDDRVVTLTIEGTE
jgi:hypothetical protein